MEELQVINHNNVDVIDSREVAEMIGKDHRHLIRDIRGYTEILKNTTEPNFGLSDFFIESNYKDSTGRTLPCYLLTRKGCDFIASRMTGKKGAQFSARYVCAFDAMRKQTDTAQAEIMLRMENCKLQKAQLLREMAQQYQGGPFEQTLNACAAKLICGSEIIPPPKSPYDLCTAGEIGEKIGITSNLVGRIANQYDLKQPEYLTITKGYARYKLERKNYTDALREIKNAMQLAPGDSELSMLAVLAAWYQGGRVLARRYYEAVKKYLDGDQIIQIRTQLGF